MKKRIAINGFGRVGRGITRLMPALMDSIRREGSRGDLEIVAINSHADPKSFAYFLKHDSVYGTSPRTIGFSLDGRVIGQARSAGELIVDDEKYLCFREESPSTLPWKELGIDVIVDGTGEFKTRSALEAHLWERGGTPVRVVACCPPKKKEEVDAILVPGINMETYDPARHRIISVASCTTNCLAPMAKVLNDAFGIEYGFVLTVHAVTLDQRLLDGSHEDYRRGRSAMANIVPTKTGAAKGIGWVIPELGDRIDGGTGKSYALMDGLADRVPVQDGSAVHLITILRDRPSKDAINKAFATAAEAGPLKGILGYDADPLVSSDVIGTTYSAVIQPDLTKAIGPLAHTFGWYDNEDGYSRRVVDVVRML